MNYTEEELRTMAKEDAATFRSEGNARLEHAISFAQMVLKSLVLVNGGAIIALLTFVGNTGTVKEPEALFWAFVWFLLGLAVILAGQIFAYLAQECFVTSTHELAWLAVARSRGGQNGKIDERLPVRGENLAMTGLISAFFSFTLFAAGAFVALDAIT